MPSKEERKGAGGREGGDRTAEKKFRKKPKQGDREAVDCVTSGDSRVCARETKTGPRKGEMRGRKTLPHTYTSDNKKGSIRRWVGGNINRGGETVLEDETASGPGEVAV